MDGPGRIEHPRAAVAISAGALHDSRGLPVGIALSASLSELARTSGRLVDDFEGPACADLMRDSARAVQIARELAADFPERVAAQRNVAMRVERLADIATSIRPEDEEALRLSRRQNRYSGAYAPTTPGTSPWQRTLHRSYRVDTARRTGSSRWAISAI